MKTFEQYLQEIHDKDYNGSGDMAGDSYEVWIDRLEVADVMMYAEEAMKEQAREIKKKEVNMNFFIREMEKDAEEYGQLHNKSCGVNCEDECDCENMRLIKAFGREWMAKISEYNREQNEPKN